MQQQYYSCLNTTFPKLKLKGGDNVSQECRYCIFTSRISYARVEASQRSYIIIEFGVIAIYKKLNKVGNDQSIIVCILGSIKAMNVQSIIVCILGSIKAMNVGQEI